MQTWLREARGKPKPRRQKWYARNGVTKPTTKEKEKRKKKKEKPCTLS